MTVKDYPTMLTLCVCGDKKSTPPEPVHCQLCVSFTHSAHNREVWK
jgi:hypothetical protein